MLENVKKLAVGLGVVFCLGLAEFDRPALLINVPTADVLGRGSLAGMVGLSLPLIDTAKSRNSGPEMNAALRFVPIDRLEIGLTAYTLKDWVMGATYQIYGPKPDVEPGEGDEVIEPWGSRKPETEEKGLAIAVGIHDIGIHKYVSPIGNGLDGAWEDWKYDRRPNERPFENLSGFAVASMPFAGIARVHLGLGRGRYTGYARGRYTNTDIFFDEPHWWAISLLGGVEMTFGEYVTLAVEADGRDVNAGVRFEFGQWHAGAAVTKIEGFTSPDPERFGRIAFMVGFKLENVYRSRPRRPEAVAGPKPVPVPEPAAEPVPVPEPETVKARWPELAPIYFELDRSSIRPEDHDVLRRNAETISSMAEAGSGQGAMIEGHCCPLATSEYNMALGMRRAESAKEYLVGLGLDPALLSTISYGEERLMETDPSRYYLNRRCEFRVRVEE